MTHKLSTLAKTQIEDIWLYTEEHWGETHATAYVGGLFNLFDALLVNKHLWRPVPRGSLSGAFYASYQEHFVFFRRLSEDDLGVLAILHQSQDIPNRLKGVDDKNHLK